MMYFISSSEKRDEVGSSKFLVNMEAMEFFSKWTYLKDGDKRVEEMIAMKEEIEGTNLKIQTSKYYIVKVPKNMVRILRCVTKYAKREKIPQHEHEFCVKYELSNEI